MRRLGCLLLLLPTLSAMVYSLATAQAEVHVSEEVVLGSLVCMFCGLVMLVKGKGSLVSPRVGSAGCASLVLLGPGALMVLMSQSETASAREVSLHGQESGLYRVTDFQPTGLRVRVTRRSKGSSDEWDLVGLAAPDGTPLLLQMGPDEPLGSDVVGRIMPFHQAEGLRALARSQNPRVHVPTTHVLERASLGWARFGKLVGQVLMAFGVALFGLGLVWSGREPGSERL